MKMSETGNKANCKQSYIKETRSRCGELLMNILTQMEEREKLK